MSHFVNAGAGFDGVAGSILSPARSLLSLLRMIATVALFLSLGLDTLAVAIGLGVGGLQRQRWVRVGVTFGFFEGVMPVIGLLVGQHLSRVFGEIASYGAGVLLLALGAWEIREAVVGDDPTAPLERPAKAEAGRAVRQDRSILITGFSVSLDELAVGFSLGVLGIALGPALLYIAVQAFVLTFLGLWLGTRVGARFGERAELAAGIVLTLLGAALIAGEATGVRLL